MEQLSLSLHRLSCTTGTNLGNITVRMAGHTKLISHSGLASFLLSPAEIKVICVHRRLILPRLQLLHPKTSAPALHSLSLTKLLLDVLLRKHIETEHNNFCILSDKMFPGKKNCGDHIQVNHTFTCKSCTDQEVQQTHEETEHTIHCLSCG